MLAIDGGEPVRALPMPARAPVEPATDSQPVATLEREFAACLDLDVSMVVACRDGATATRVVLDLAVQGRGGREVVLPALLEGAALDAVLDAGLTPVPAEVEAETGALSARGLARALGDDTAAILVEHTFGHPAAMNELARVAARVEAPIVEDASGALGGRYRGEPVGTIGQAGLFAFGAHHLVTGGGHGGAVIVSRDPTLASAARAVVADAPIAEEAARIALTELRRAPVDLDERRRLAWHLTYELRGTRALSAMHHARWVRHGYDRYVVRMRDIFWKRPLDATIEALRAEGVPCERALGAPLQADPRVRSALDGAEADARLKNDHFPVSARLPEELIAISLNGAETVNDMNDVAAALRKVEAEST